MQGGRVVLATVFVLAVLVCLTSAKIVNRSIRPLQIKKSGNIYYVTKFAMDVGKGEFKAKAKFEKRPLLDENIKG